MSSDETEITKLNLIRTLELKRPYLTVMSGKDIAIRYLLDQNEMVIGRTTVAQIVLNEANVSRQHARLTVSENTVLVEDLDSTNGTYVNGLPITQCVLQDGDILGIGKTILKFAWQSEIENAFHEEVIDTARYDAVTGLMSRRFFRKYLESEFARVQRYGGQLSLLICDLDDFKHINDTYGHHIGDKVLRQMGDELCACIRNKIDVAGRYGGDELIVLLPATSLEMARIVGEKIRTRLAQLEITPADGHCTISIGIGTSSAAIDNPDALLRAADEKLYLAKEKGKNRVEG
ncbi:MAG: GGDEF domain-containing protein [Gammaproteobacteria bacterium]